MSQDKTHLYDMYDGHLPTDVQWDSFKEPAFPIRNTADPESIPIPSWVNALPEDIQKKICPDNTQKKAINEYDSNKTQIYADFKAAVSTKFFNSYFIKNDETKPDELSFKFTNVSNDNLTPQKIRQTINRTLNLSLEDSDGIIEYMPSPVWIDGRIHLPKMPQQYLEAATKGIIGNFGFIYPQKCLTMKHPVILVSFFNEYTDDTNEVHKSKVLNLLCQTYETEDSIRFTVEPADRPGMGTVMVADITVPGYKGPEPIDVTTQDDYWIDYYEAAGLEPPHILDSEVVFFKDYWHIYYLFDNVYKQYPPSRLPKRNTRFSIPTDNNCCIYCRQTGHTIRCCSTAPKNKKTPKKKPVDHRPQKVGGVH